MTMAGMTRCCTRPEPVDLLVDGLAVCSRKGVRQRPEDRGMSDTQTLAVHPATGWTVDGATGRVFGAARRNKGKVIGSVAKTGYLVSSAAGGRDHYLHRVVWEACVGPIPEGLVINHINGVKADNRLENLEVVTHGENMSHAMRTGLKPRCGGAAGRTGSEHHSYRVTPEMREDILRLGQVGAKQRDIATRHGISQRTVWQVLQDAR